MKQINITIPLRYNDGSPIEHDKLRKIRNELIRKFGGLSISSEIEGFWYHNDIIYSDFNKIYTIVVEDNPDNINFIAIFKSFLKEYLDQKDIFITINEVELI